MAIAARLSCRARWKGVDSLHRPYPKSHLLFSIKIIYPIVKEPLFLRLSLKETLAQGFRSLVCCFVRNAIYYSTHGFSLQQLFHKFYISIFSLSKPRSRTFLSVGSASLSLLFLVSIVSVHLTHRPRRFQKPLPSRHIHCQSTCSNDHLPRATT